MNKFKIAIFNKTGRIYEEEISYAKLPSVSGDVGILANHASMICLLKKGEIEIKRENGLNKFQIEQGLAEVNKNKLKVLIFK
jgi:F-type H+-transporting ATPase subunit epsilon